MSHACNPPSGNAEGSIGLTTAGFSESASTGTATAGLAAATAALALALTASWSMLVFFSLLSAVAWASLSVSADCASSLMLLAAISSSGFVLERLVLGESACLDALGDSGT